MPPRPKGMPLFYGRGCQVVLLGGPRGEGERGIYLSLRDNLCG